jgi:hypothetical protein
MDVSLSPKLESADADRIRSARALKQPSWCHCEARDMRYWQLSPRRRRTLLLKTLDDPAAYKDVFGHLIDDGPRALVDCLEGLAEKALKPIGMVTVPIAVVVAAVLALKGRVKRRSRGNPGHSLRVHRRKKRAGLLRRLHPREDQMIVWARERMKEIKAAAKAKGERIKAHNARIAAASETKKRFSSLLSIVNIADRMSRPGKYAPREAANRKRHPGKISGGKTPN